jgi:hypothetical protein
VSGKSVIGDRHSVVGVRAVGGHEDVRAAGVIEERWKAWRSTGSGWKKLGMRGGVGWSWIGCLRRRRTKKVFATLNRESGGEIRFSRISKTAGEPTKRDVGWSATGSSAMGWSAM